MEENKNQSCLNFVTDWRLLDLNSITNLECINYNKIIKIESIERQCFQDFTNLETLLNSNLAKIDPYSFQHLSKLNKLDLNENQINQIETNGFQGLENLEELHLNSTVKISFLTRTRSFCVRPSFAFRPLTFAFRPLTFH